MPMRGLRIVAGVAAVLATAACVVPPRPGTPTPPRVDLTDTRATRYGASGSEVLAQEAVAGAVHALFGVEWSAPSALPGRITAPAGEFFTRPSAPRLVRADGIPYVAVSGCRREDCLSGRGLLLLRDDGAQFLARLDDGGYLTTTCAARRGPAASAPRPGRCWTRSGGRWRLRPTGVPEPAPEGADPGPKGTERALAAPRGAYPPAMAPTILKGSAPATTVSGSGASSPSWERSRPQAKNRTKSRRRPVAGSRIVPRSPG